MEAVYDEIGHSQESPASQTSGLPRPFGRRWAKRARYSM